MIAAIAIPSACTQPKPRRIAPAAPSANHLPCASHPFRQLSRLRPVHREILKRRQIQGPIARATFIVERALHTYIATHRDYARAHRAVTRCSGSTGAGPTLQGAARSRVADPSSCASAPSPVRQAAKSPSRHAAAGFGGCFSYFERLRHPFCSVCKGGALSVRHQHAHPLPSVLRRWLRACEVATPLSPLIAHGPPTSIDHPPTRINSLVLFSPRGMQEILETRTARSYNCIQRSISNIEDEIKFAFAPPPDAIGPDPAMSYGPLSCLQRPVPHRPIAHRRRPAARVHYRWDKYKLLTYRPSRNRIACSPRSDLRPRRARHVAPTVVAQGTQFAQFTGLIIGGPWRCTVHPRNVAPGARLAGETGEGGPEMLGSEGPGLARLQAGDYEMWRLAPVGQVGQVKGIRWCWAVKGPGLACLQVGGCRLGQGVRGWNRAALDCTGYLLGVPQ